MIGLELYRTMQIGLVLSCDKLLGKAPSIVDKRDLADVAALGDTLKIDLNTNSPDLIKQFRDGAIVQTRACDDALNRDRTIFLSVRQRNARSAPIPIHKRVELQPA